MRKKTDADNGSVQNSSLKCQFCGGSQDLNDCQFYIDEFYN